MSTPFSLTLAQLRAEKSVSQRQSARELGVSQALLSHYETGAREPGFKFLCKAADYYQVSTDFLLGRTALRDGAAIRVDELHDAAQDKDSHLNGIPSAKLGKRLTINAVSVLYDLLGRSRSTALTGAVTAYLQLAVYKLFHALYLRKGRTMESFFPVEEHLAAQTIQMAQLRTETALLRVLHDKKQTLSGMPEITGESLQEQYPELAQSLLTVLHQAKGQLTIDN